ncbi:MAG: ABC-2 family transporter protein [Lachnospiraceae bacterium]|nr:ABC-2 family transporter protein [Lachnospiraceae bacterium]
MQLYRKYLQIQVQSMMQYKTSFLLTAIGQFLVSFNVFLGVFFMFRRFHVVEGFTYSEVLLCFSITLMEFSLAEAVARGFDTFSGTVRKGEFDRILVRPKNEIFQVLASRIELTRIGRMLQAIVMFVYGIAESQVEWTFLKVLAVIFMLIGGTLVFAGIFLIYAAICFFTLEGLEFMNVLTDGAREYGKYPVNVYGKRVLQFCTFVVPYALIQYYPLCYILGRDSRWWYLFLPLLAPVFLIPCYGLWRFGVRHYASAGS